jgi:hypothetical protein
MNESQERELLQLSTEEDYLCALVQSIWRYHRRYHNRVAVRLDNGRKEYGKIAARLKTYSIYDLKKAIDNYNRPGSWSARTGKCRDLEYLMRNDGIVETFLGEHNEQPDYLADIARNG